MRKKELVVEIAKALELNTGEVDVVLKAFHEEVIKIINAGDSINLPELGTFYAQEHKGHRAYLPSIKKKVMLPPSRRVHFRPSTEFKNRAEETAHE